MENKKFSELTVKIETVNMTPSTNVATIGILMTFANTTSLIEVIAISEDY